MVNQSLLCRHDCSGRIMATISSEGPAFFYDARPSSQFAVLGYTGAFNAQPPNSVLI